MLDHEAGNDIGPSEDVGDGAIAPQNDRGEECECSSQHPPSPAGDSRDGVGLGDPRRNSSQVAFWNVNIPRSEWTDACPDYLQYAFKDHKDRAVLSTLDVDYQRQSWGEVHDLIRGNRLDLFKRVPSQLRLYRVYCHKLVREHGSIMNFVLKERLHWHDLTASSSPAFTNPDDFAILHNDWPYGVDERIVHLVVWTKFHLPVDPDSEVGDMAPETRELVNRFVNETFVSKCGRENVIWFKNWSSLKSVHAVEHFHIMLFGPDMEFVRQITRNDSPLYQKVKV